MTPTTQDEPLFSMLLASYREYPVWKQIGTGIAMLILSPALLLIGIIVALSLFPFFLFGRFEGDLGKAPFTHEVTRIVRQRLQRTERYYEDL